VFAPPAPADDDPVPPVEYVTGLPVILKD